MHAAPRTNGPQAPPGRLDRRLARGANAVVGAVDGASLADAATGRAPYTPATIHRMTSSPRRQGSLAWANPALLTVAAAATLTLFGAAAIDTTEPALARKQLLFAAVGVVGAALAAIPSPRRIRELAWPLYVATLVLLVLVLVPFMPEWLVHARKGSRRWINLGFVDFQPSELAKLSYVLVLALWLRTSDHHRRLVGLLPPFVLTLAPMALVLVEPDLGTSLLFVPTLMAMLIAAGAKKRHIGAIVGLGLLVAPLSYPVLEPHQRARIDALVAQIRGDDRYEQDIGFQGARAMTLVGAGGVGGVGREHADALVTYNGLPEEHNDMIFAVVCCRWGLVGGVATWLLFLLAGIGGVLTAAAAREPFARLVAVGLTTLLLAQAIINTGMTLGLLPITGMTLPFVSYGGSSLVATWVMVGVLFGVALRRDRFRLHESFEFGEEGT